MKHMGRFGSLSWKVRLWVQKQQYLAMFPCHATTAAFISENKLESVKSVVLEKLYIQLMLSFYFKTVSLNKIKTSINKKRAF